MNDEIQAYQALLERKMAEDSPDIFSNYTKAHAECIIKTFLSGAKTSVVIFSGGFEGDFYNGDDMVQRFIVPAVKYRYERHTERACP